MNLPTLVLGVIVFLAGLGITILTPIFLRRHRATNILSGIGFAVIGFLIAWFSVLGGATIRIPAAIPDRQVGIILFGLVVSLFVLKGFLEIRAGIRNLRDKSITPLQIARNRFRIAAAAFVTVGILGILLLAITNFGR